MPSKRLHSVVKMYDVYEDGKIFDKDKGVFVKSHTTSKGYEAFYCKEIKRDMLVHRFVLFSFFPIENVERLQVNHIDGDKSNNSLSNLEWVTPSDNLRHAFSTGLKTQTGENNSFSVLKEDDVMNIINQLLNGVRVCNIAKEFGVTHQTISNIKLKRAWTHLTQGVEFPNIRKSKSRKFND